MFLRDRSWIGAWHETGAIGQSSTYYLGAVAATLSALTSANQKRVSKSNPEGKHTSPQANSGASRIIWTAAIFSLPHLLGQLIGFLLTSRSSPPGLHLFWGYLALGQVVILLSVSIGWLCGAVLSRISSIIVSGGGWVLLIAASDAGPINVVMRGRPEMAVDSFALAIRAMAVSALLASLAWTTSKNTACQRLPRLVPTSVATILVVASFSYGADVVKLRIPPEASALCISGRVRICVWPEQEKYLVDLAHTSARIDALPDVFEKPYEINSTGLKGTDNQASQRSGRESEPSPTFEIIGGSIWSYAGAFAAAIERETFRFTDELCQWRNLSPADDRRLLVLDAWLEAYLAGNGQPDYRTNAPPSIQGAFLEGRAIANGRTASDQFKWAEKEVIEMRQRYC
ncbi:hypothetical protein ACQP1S_27435 [Micromonospora matsumotoense]|uniref:hypothetical protein n=1 Tax=Micromonospora matsumotoense TaxID=121616 RepID=UPI003D94AF22